MPIVPFLLSLVEAYFLLSSIKMIEALYAATLGSTKLGHFADGHCYGYVSSNFLSKYSTGLSNSDGEHKNKSYPLERM